MLKTIKRGPEIQRTGNSILYRSELFEDQSSIAVVEKKLLPHIPLSELKREAAALSALQHPNIINLAEWNLRDRTLATVYVPGLTLMNIVSFQGAMHTAQVMRIGASLAGALSCMHVRADPIVHYDISDGNIQLAPHGPVLMDFGKAFPLSRIPPSYFADNVGSPFFMSPEKYRREPHLGRQSDIFALGILFYRLASGEYPFRPDCGSLERQVFQDTPLHISTLPKGLHQLIDNCLDKDPYSRPTADQVQAELESLLVAAS